MSSSSWCVAGGGMLGMTLALRLAQAGMKVTLVEGAEQLGGLADAWQLGDLTWDRHYHVTLLSDKYLRDLLTELDLEKEIEWVETKTGFYVDGKLYSLSSSLEFLTFPPLNLWQKFRLGASIFYASRVRDGRSLEQTLVSDWLTRLSGRGVFEKIWRPLLQAKLGENYTRSSAAFIWATIQRLYAARRTGLKKEMFGYVPGGYARIVERFTEKLMAVGVEIRTGFAIDRVRKSSSGFEITARDGRSISSDRAALTVPARIAAQACDDLNMTERTLMSDVEYQGIVCASLLLKKPLSPYYVTNITDSWVPFTGVIEMTALVNPAHFGGRSLVYLPKYLPADHAMYAESDDSIRERFTAALARMYPHFSPDDIEAFRISRARYVMPLPTLGYSDRLPPQETSVPGLFCVNAAHIVNGTLNVNETVKLAEQAMPMLLKSASEQVARETVHV